MNTGLSAFVCQSAAGFMLPTLLTATRAFMVVAYQGDCPFGESVMRTGSN